MSEYQATISWQRDEQKFTDKRYSRGHQWQFDGGAVIQASSSPSVVPLPWSVAENVDPEEAFVASLSSCHMLFFLSIAAANGYCIDDYQDKATGVMAKNAEGKMVMTEVMLKPHVVFSGDKRPDERKLEKMHHQAHDQCFLANSVTTAIHCEGSMA